MRIVARPRLLPFNSPLGIVTLVAVALLLASQFKLLISLTGLHPKVLEDDPGTVMVSPDAAQGTSLKSIENTLQQMLNRLDKIDETLKKVDSLEKKVDTLEKKVDTLPSTDAVKNQLAALVQTHIVSLPAHMSTVPQISYPVAPSEENRRLRSIVLLGPHDRFNFGDLLFSKVLSRLLEQRAGYDASRILFGGLVPINMTRYGGPTQIFSMKQIQHMSQTDHLYGPYDIVYTGGEAMGCDHACGVDMLPTLKLRQLARKEKISDCAYLVPKKLLLPKQPVGGRSLSSSKQNYAVVNSMGGVPTGPCETAIASADFIGYRDKGTIPTPDSAVMTKELFYREINAMAKVVSDELGSFFREAQGSGGRYIAVQHTGFGHGQKFGWNKRILAQTLDLVSRHMKAPVIFFAAGTAPHHDDFSVYDEVSSLMEERSFVYRSEHALKVVALISGAEAVLGTSLHVRIMAFIYFKPRVTWCTLTKHEKFIQLWDAFNAPSCVKVKETLPILAKYVGTSPEITQNETIAAYEKAVRQYVSFFDGWSRKLLQHNDES